MAFRTREELAQLPLLPPGTEPIASFDAAFRFLSNFWPSLVRIRAEAHGEVLEMPTVEHAYQALKTLDPFERTRISFLPTPGQAKRAGQRLELRPDWELIKVPVMRALLVQKFAHEDLRKLLLATGERELIEGNTWNDTFWGVCRGRGSNHLGKLLMEVRAQIRAQG